MHLRGLGELSFHLLILEKADDVCGKSDDDDDDCFFNQLLALKQKRAH